MTGAQPEPVALGTARGRWLVAVTVLASGMAFVDATAVQVALPAIGRELDASLSGLQWTISGYTLALASLILLGRLARRPLRTAPRLPRRGRLVRRGLADLRAGPDHRPAGGRPGPAGRGRRAADPRQPGPHPVLVPARSTGRRRSACGRRWPASPGLIGPFLGGVLVDAVSWRLVFLLNVPVAVLILAVAGRHVPESRDPAHHGRFDHLGAVLGALALGGVTYALIGAGENMLAARRGRLRGGRARRPASPSSCASGARRTRCCRWGCSRTGSSPAPTWPPSPSTGRSAAAALFLVLQLQTVLGYDATAAGAAMLPSILLHHAALAHGRRAGDAHRPAAADDRRPAPGRCRDVAAGRRRRQPPLRARGPPRLAAPGPRHGRWS